MKTQYLKMELNTADGNGKYEEDFSTETPFGGKQITVELQVTSRK